MGVFDAFAAAQGTELTLSKVHENTKGDDQLLRKSTGSHTNAWHLDARQIDA